MLKCISRKPYEDLFIKMSPLSFLQDIVRRLTRLEADLEEERQANEELQAELRERELEEDERLREAGTAERRLATAEDQIDDLKSALMHLRNDAEVDPVLHLLCSSACR